MTLWRSTIECISRHLKSVMVNVFSYSEHTDGTVQIEFNPASKYSFTQEVLSTRPSTSSKNLKSVNFAPNIPIPIYQQQESPPMSPTHFDMCHSQVNIIHKKNYKRTPFKPNIEWIKLDYFSPYNKPRRAYFQTLLPQARNSLRKQYESYMNQNKITILFFHWFFKL